MPPELRVHGPWWARAATDAAAVAGGLSLIVSLWWGPVVIALFALVLFGLTVPRVAGLPGVLQAVSGATILLAAWAATLDWYATLPQLDLLVHALANGLLSVMLVMVLARVGVLPSGLPRAGLVLVVTAVGALLGVLWEIGEWAGHTWLDDAINVGYDDTVGDLAAGTLGSAVGGALLGSSRRGHDE